MVKINQIVEANYEHYSDAEWAYRSALQRDREGLGRSLDLEKRIMKNMNLVFAYVAEVLQDRWIEAEPLVLNHIGYINYYLNIIPREERIGFLQENKNQIIKTILITIKSNFDLDFSFIVENILQYVNWPELYIIQKSLKNNEK